MIYSLVSVVVDDFYVVGVAVTPSETDTPLVVDPDAVLAFAIAFEGFEPIGRRYAQIIQGDAGSPTRGHTDAGSGLSS
jgi:hypothetical protein